MTANNGFPNMTTAGQGLFNGASSNGMIQGQADPDPATRFALRSGVVSNSETVPMWGGIAVYADIPSNSNSGPRPALGPILGRATAEGGATGIMGFTVFDQGYNMVTDPMNTVPTAGSGQSINYYPLGCRARIAVKCSSALVALQGSQINPQVSWDYVNEELIPYDGVAALPVVVLDVQAAGCMTVQTVGGNIVYNYNDACAKIQLTGGTVA